MRISDWSSDVCSSDLPEARLFRQPAIVGDEALAACRQRRLDHRMAATLDLEARVIDEIGARPAAFDRAFGEARGNVESGERLGGGGDGPAGLQCQIGSASVRANVVQSV